MRPSAARAPVVAAALVWGVGAGCTLIESRSGLVGPPSPDAGSTGVSDSGITDEEASPPQTHDGGPDALPNDDSSPIDDAPSVDGPAIDDAPSINDSSPDQDAPPAESGVADAGPAAVLYDGLFNPLGITVFGGDVCWVEGRTTKGLYCAPSAGAGAVRRIDTTGDMSFLVDAVDLALDGTYLYWSDGAQNQVVRRLLDGGVAAEYFTGPGHVSFIVLDGKSVWATDYVADGGPNQGTVVVGPSDGGPTSTLIYSAQRGASGVGVQRGTVYWGLARGNGVAYGPFGGNVAPTVVSVNGAVGGVAVDSDGTVYFLEGNQNVMRIPALSSQAESMYSAPAPFGLGDIAVDDSWIYWTEPDLGRIVRLHK